MTPAQKRLSAWLRDQESRLRRFHTPIPVDVVAAEAQLAAVDVLDATRTGLVHHIWPHVHRGQARPSKPYCLRENGPNTVGIDQEDSVIGACEAEFRRHGYQTCREVGTPDDVDVLRDELDLSRLSPGTNQRDLFALRRSDRRVDLWLVEAKGKEAAEFDHYTVAEAIGQLFPVPAEPLSALLGGPRAPATDGARRSLRACSRPGPRADTT